MCSLHLVIITMLLDTKIDGISVTMRMVQAAVVFTSGVILTVVVITGRSVVAKL